MNCKEINEGILVLIQNSVMHLITQETKKKKKKLQICQDIKYSITKHTGMVACDGRPWNFYLFHLPERTITVFSHFYFYFSNTWINNSSSFLPC